MRVDEVPPVVYDRFAAVPGLRGLACLWDIVFDAVGMSERLAGRHGGVFTIRIPFTFDITYLTGPDAYRAVMALPPSHAAIGQVMSNVPTIGYWFPRTADDPDSLQELVVTGRRLVAGLLTRERIDNLALTATAVADRRVAGWTDRTDLAAQVPAAVYESAIRSLGGDVLWDLAGDAIVPLYRRIANGIDIPRATLARTPLHRLMPEYRATRELAGLLRDTYGALRGRGSPTVDAIERLDVPAADAVWLLMYVLWNATAYPGSYTFWTLVDILERPELLARLRTMPDPSDRRVLLGCCLFETVRLNPVSSLLRYLVRPWTYEGDGRRYRIPAGGYVGVLPRLLNQDPDRFGRPDSYDPSRYRAGERPTVFGRGPFGCVAQEFSRVLTAATVDAVLSRSEPVLATATPARRRRVHLNYPSHAVYASTVVRYPPERVSTVRP